MNRNLFQIFLFGLAFIFGIILCGSFGLGVDEAHYMLYARYLDWSYFDHPPLVGWVHALFNKLGGESEISARLPALIIGLVNSSFVFSNLQNMRFSVRASLLGMLAYGFCLQFFVLNLFLLPDTILLFLFWPLFLVLKRFSSNQSKLQDWVQLGLILGLMGLTKYTAVLFLVPLLLYFFNLKRFRFFTEPGFYVAILVGLILIMPVLYWNAHHDWISFRYQLSHVTSGGIGFLGFLKSLALQVLLYGPFLWPFSVFGLYVLSKETRFEIKFLFWSAVTVAVFFIKSSSQEVNLPHWPALFYMITIPIGVAAAVDSTQHFLQKLTFTMVSLSIAFICTLALLIRSNFIYHLAPLAMREVVGWPHVMQEVVQVANQIEKASGLNNLPIVFGNWTYGSRALYYGYKANSNIRDRVFILDDRYDQFDLWNSSLSSTSEKRSKYIYVQFGFDSELNCFEKNKVHSFDVSVGSAQIYEVHIYFCHEPEQPK